MPFNFDVIGKQGPPSIYSWTKDDAMLYALAVGAGQHDPAAELEFTTENSGGIQFAVLPTFVNLFTLHRMDGLNLGEIDLASVLHAEQAFTLHQPIPVEGSVQSIGQVVQIYDKGKAAILVTETKSIEVTSGELLATCRSATYIRGEGGFGGDRGPRETWELPVREPDVSVTMPTRSDQALLYRLTGDHNPLHSDPSFAPRAGFDRPILHGMCTYGFTARALLHEVCDSDVGRWVSMTGRFSSPVYPGDALTVEAWVNGTTARFRTSSPNGIAIDRGVLIFAS